MEVEQNNRLKKRKFIIFSVDSCSDQYLVKYPSNNSKFMLVAKVTFHRNHLRKFFCCFLFLPSVVLQGVGNGSQQRRNSAHFAVFDVRDVPLTGTPVVENGL